MSDWREVFEAAKRAATLRAVHDARIAMRLALAPLTVPLRPNDAPNRAPTTSAPGDPP